MLILSLLLIAGITAVILFMQNASFGAAPDGDSLKKIQGSPNFRNGKFQNQHLTPALTEGAGFFGVLKKFFFEKNKRNLPSTPLPSVKTNLLNLNPEKNILVWFGHSSYFLQICRKTILVDPVFSGNASPLRFTTRSFAGTDIYSVDDLPFIDYLFLTHDHWDHLDYRTLKKLKPKVNQIITGLGVAAHLHRWGYNPSAIEEMDWYQEIHLEPGFVVNSLTARHFSGRGFKRNGTIWSSFLLTTPQKKIYIGGDSGYDLHFAEIGHRFGPLDLAILEDGQYNQDWKYIHMNPEETVQAAMDLQAKKLMPVHWAKFALSLHSWDEPIIRIKKEASVKNMNLLHPKIGEAVDLDGDPVFDNWWEGIQ
jgi:L-ascorbate metabolism protein UlaG (beta-lactamase superfamily)